MVAISRTSVVLATLLPLIQAQPTESLTSRSLVDDALNWLQDHVFNNKKPAPADDYSCKSTIHPNPVILLHGQGSTRDSDLTELHQNLTDQGYCIFAPTYGVGANLPWAGGLTSMKDVSSLEVYKYMLDVKAKTGAGKIDCVGHSQGGSQCLYASMMHPDIADITERIVAMGPDVGGCRYYGLSSFLAIGNATLPSFLTKPLSDYLNNKCAACVELTPSGAVVQQFQDALGHIVPDHIKATIIASAADYTIEAEDSYINQPNVVNITIQDTCPHDHVGHSGLSTDTGVWSHVFNALNDNPSGPIQCDDNLIPI